MNQPRLRWWHYIVLPLWSFWWGFEEVRDGLLETVRWRHIIALMAISATVGYLMGAG